MKVARYPVLATILARLQFDRGDLEKSKIHWDEHIYFVKADFLGFLEGVTVVGARKAIARVHFHHAASFDKTRRNNAIIKHAIEQRATVTELPLILVDLTRSLIN